MSFGLGVGDITGSTRHAEQRTQKRSKKQTAQAVSQLDPAFILHMMQQFISPSNAAFMGMLNQSKEEAGTGLARRGLTGTGFGQATLAGIPGQIHMQAYMDALNKAFGLAGHRASIYAGQPLVQGQANPISFNISGKPQFGPFNKSPLP